MKSIPITIEDVSVYIGPGDISGNNFDLLSKDEKAYHKGYCNYGCPATGKG